MKGRHFHNLVLRWYSGKWHSVVARGVFVSLHCGHNRRRVQVMMIIIRTSRGLLIAFRGSVIKRILCIAPAPAFMGGLPILTL